MHIIRIHVLQQQRQPLLIAKNEQPQLKPASPLALPRVSPAPAGQTAGGGAGRSQAAAPVRRGLRALLWGRVRDVPRPRETTQASQTAGCARLEQGASLLRMHPLAQQMVLTPHASASGLRDPAGLSSVQVSASRTNWSCVSQLIAFLRKKSPVINITLPRWRGTTVVDS